MKKGLTSRLLLFIIGVNSSFIFGVVKEAVDNQLPFAGVAQDLYDDTPLQDQKEFLSVKKEDKKLSKSRKKTKKKTRKTKETNKERKLDRLVQKDERERGKIVLGRDYYYSLIDKASERRWTVPASFHYSFANSALGQRCQDQDLSHLIFGQSLSIADVFLLSKLSDDNKIKFDRDLNGRSSFEYLKGALVRSGNGGEAHWGNYRSDQYLAGLAPVQVHMSGMEESELGFNISAVHRFNITESDNVVGFIGVTLPVKSVVHRIADFDLCCDGTLFSSAFSQAGGTTRQNTLDEFFADFVSVDDFFNRAVLAPKKLILRRRQQRDGIGDFALFGLVDFGGAWEYADGIQLGLTTIFPTAKKTSGRYVWEPVLGAGAYQFEPFFNILFHSPSAVFNPSFRLVGSISKRFTSLQRVPKQNGFGMEGDLSTNSLKKVRDIEGLINPIKRFNEYWVAPFDQEFDSSIAAFSDNVVPTCVKRGKRILVGIGNYFYNVFNLGFRLGVFYDYLHKWHDEVSVTSCSDCPETQGTFNTCLLEERTEQHAHNVGLNLTYKFENLLELNVGTQHTIAGKNVPRNREIFASMIVVF